MNNLKIIPNYPDYLINEKGEVFSKKRNHFTQLKLNKTTNGYFNVSLYSKGKQRTEKVHRLVLMAFDRMPEQGEVCRHFPDNDKSNNHISNLQWGTQKENVNDTWYVHKTANPVYGKNNGRHKLSYKKVKDIRRLYATGNYTYKGLAKFYKVAVNTIHRVVNNITWRK